MKNNTNFNTKLKAVVLGLCILLSCIGCSYDVSKISDGVNQKQSETQIMQDSDSKDSISTGTESEDDSAKKDKANKNCLDEIPAYEGYACVAINDNTPFFTDREKKNTKAFENYTKLDKLGRCQLAYANLCPKLWPTEERGEIGSIKPTGWHTVKYSGIVEGNYLYNRCHLIGFQLAGENANKKNLITGTRYLNVIGMLPIENVVDDYIEETGNHVLYRVTPVFEGNDLVAKGVLMEGWSVEDKGKGICFNYFCFNVQPGIGIDYSTGESWEDESVVAKDYSYGSDYKQNDNSKNNYNNNDSSKNITVWISATGSKYHSKNNCGTMNPDKAVKIKLSEAQKQGYGKCGRCW